MFEDIRTFMSDETGATAIEYTMIAAFIAIAIVAVLPLIGTNLRDRFQAVYNALAN